MSRVLVLNGPNLGRLGSREPEVYGTATYTSSSPRARRPARRSGWRSRCARPTSESELVGWLHEAADAGVPVVLNPAAFTHYSYALRDACAMLTAPLVEVHLTNPAAREEFRHTSVVAGVATGTRDRLRPRLLPAGAEGDRGRGRQRPAVRLDRMPDTHAVRRDRLRALVAEAPPRPRAWWSPGWSTSAT